MRRSKPDTNPIVDDPAARRLAIRLFCSATIFCASHTRRWGSARGSSSAMLLFGALIRTRSFPAKRGARTRIRSADRDPRGRLMGTPSAESADARLGPRAWTRKTPKINLRCAALYPLCIQTILCMLNLCFDPKKGLIPLGHTVFDEVALVLQHFQAWSTSNTKSWIEWRKAAGV